ncbi:hypothetical protein BGZ46_009349 [Entomortierella lignicola]|nr:hypothetical protein BGZ46_009349 [Entomortierella lignicola]
MDMEKKHNLGAKLHKHLIDGYTSKVMQPSQQTTTPKLVYGSSFDYKERRKRLRLLPPSPPAGLNPFHAPTVNALEGMFERVMAIASASNKSSSVSTKRPPNPQRRHLVDHGKPQERDTIALWPADLQPGPSIAKSNHVHKNGDMSRNRSVWSTLLEPVSSTHTGTSQNTYRYMIPPSDALHTLGLQEMPSQKTELTHRESLAPVTETLKVEQQARPYLKRDRSPSPAGDSGEDGSSVVELLSSDDENSTEKTHAEDVEEFTEEEEDIEFSAEEEEYESHEEYDDGEFDKYDQARDIMEEDGEERILEPVRFQKPPGIVSLDDSDVEQDVQEDRHYHEEEVREEQENESTRNFNFSLQHNGQNQRWHDNRGSIESYGSDTRPQQYFTLKSFEPKHNHSREEEFRDDEEAEREYTDEEYDEERERSPSYYSDAEAGTPEQVTWSPKLESEDSPPPGPSSDSVLLLDSDNEEQEEDGILSSVGEDEIEDVEDVEEEMEEDELVSNDGQDEIEDVVIAEKEGEEKEQDDSVRYNPHEVTESYDIVIGGETSSNQHNEQLHERFGSTQDAIEQIIDSTPQILPNIGSEFELIPTRDVIETKGEEVVLELGDGVDGLEMNTISAIDSIAQLSGSAEQLTDPSTFEILEAVPHTIANISVAGDPSASTSPFNPEHVSLLERLRAVAQEEKITLIARDLSPDMDLDQFPAIVPNTQPLVPISLDPQPPVQPRRSRLTRTGTMVQTVKDGKAFIEQIEAKSSPSKKNSQSMQPFSNAADISNDIPLSPTLSAISASESNAESVSTTTGSMRQRSEVRLLVEEARAFCSGIPGPSRTGSSISSASAPPALSNPTQAYRPLTVDTIASLPLKAQSAGSSPSRGLSFIRRRISVGDGNESSSSVGSEQQTLASLTSSTSPSRIGGVGVVDLAAENVIQSTVVGSHALRLFINSPLPAGSNSGTQAVSQTSGQESPINSPGRPIAPSFTFGQMPPGISGSENSVSNNSSSNTSVGFSFGMSFITPKQSSSETSPMTPSRNDTSVVDVFSPSASDSKTVSKNPQDETSFEGAKGNFGHDDRLEGEYEGIGDEDGEDGEDDEEEHGEDQQHQVDSENENGNDGPSLDFAPVHESQSGGSPILVRAPKKRRTSSQTKKKNMKRREANKLQKQQSNSGDSTHAETSADAQ